MRARPSSAVRNTVRFVLPPSLGEPAARERALQLEQFLTSALGRTAEVAVARSYEALTKDLLAGRADLAWAPPFVCARIESMGARVSLRTVRQGVSAFRSALLCREDKAVTLQTLSGKRAAWVDPDSVGGYLLAIAHLKAQQIDPGKTFFSQEFVGSYRAALEAVVEGRADVTSIFAPAAREGQPQLHAVEEVAPDLASRFNVIAWTDAAPNDGVAVCPSADGHLVASVEEVLLALREGPGGSGVLGKVFNAEAFERAPRMGYRALYRVALASL